LVCRQDRIPSSPPFSWSVYRVGRARHWISHYTNKYCRSLRRRSGAAGPAREGECILVSREHSLELFEIVYRISPWACLLKMKNWQCEWAFEVIQPFALGFTKLSILYFYRRIFRGRFFNLTIWVLIEITTTWLIAFEFAAIFDCNTHFSANWGSLAELKANCDNSFSELAAYSISDVIIDIFILVLPIPLVRDLQGASKRGTTEVQHWMMLNLSPGVEVTDANASESPCLWNTFNGSLVSHCHDMTN